MNTQGIEQVAARQWATRPADQRFESLEELRTSVANRRSVSMAYDFDMTALEVKELNDTVVVNGRITPSEPSHWAFGQLCRQVSAPAGYLRTLPNKLVVDCLNTSIKSASREAVKFMTIRNDADGALANTLQAVTSTTYGRIWDADVVDAVARIQEKSGGRFDNPLSWERKEDGSRKKAGLYASDHDIFVFMVDGGSIVDAGTTAKGEADTLHRGFITWNSETGASTFGLMTFLFRQVCGNHLIWGAQDVNKLLIRHTSGGPGRFDTQVLPALASYLNASAQAEGDAIKRAKELLLPANLEEAIAQVGKWGKFTRGEIRDAVEYAKREEGDARNLWNLIQGFTAQARDLQFADARVDLEKRAGKLMEVVSNN